MESKRIKSVLTPITEPGKGLIDSCLDQFTTASTKALDSVLLQAIQRIIPEASIENVHTFADRLTAVQPSLLKQYPMQMFVDGKHVCTLYEPRTEMQDGQMKYVQRYRMI